MPHADSASHGQTNSMHAHPTCYRGGSRNFERDSKSVTIKKKGQQFFTRPVLIATVTHFHGYLRDQGVLKPQNTMSTCHCQIDSTMMV